MQRWHIRHSTSHDRWPKLSGQAQDQRFEYLSRSSGRGMAPLQFKIRIQQPLIQLSTPLAPDRSQLSFRFFQFAGKISKAGLP